MIGIVASKLVETFKVPAIVFTDASEEGIIKASIRSAGELNIFEALQSCSDLFIKFGGHKAAAGLSMPKENLDQLKDRLHHFLKDIPEIVRTRQARVDMEIKPEPGKLIIFSNSQHLHYVSEVGAAERFVLSFWYARPAS